MSKYSEISKKIGWDPQEVSYPSLEKTKELFQKIVNQHDERAFEEVFRIHRFAPSYVREHEEEVAWVIYNAYTSGSEIFKNK